MVAVFNLWTVEKGQIATVVCLFSTSCIQPPRSTDNTKDLFVRDDTRELARSFAAALSLPTSEFGGKSFRIGGATDWRDVFGADAERIIVQRGRWHSDIGLIYQRALAESHLRGSADVGNAAHSDLESLCRGWTQPANFR